MIVYWGLVAGSKPAKYRVEVNAPNAGAEQERGTAAAAKALARQLAGGRADRIKRTTFPAAAPAPSKPAAPTDDEADEAAPTDDEAAPTDDEADDIAEADELVKSSAKITIAAVEDGVWYSPRGAVEIATVGDIDAVEAAEQRRAGGARVTVLRAIEKRRAAE